MRFLPKKFAFRRRPLAWGMMSGLLIALSLFVLSVPFLAPTALDAADAADACFTRRDCSFAMATETMCESRTGCCIADRCFVPSSSCLSEGTEITGLCFARNPPFQLVVNFGSKNTVVDLGDYINTVYKYAITIGGMMAAVMMMIGGFLYLTAADSGRISRGKQFIVDALTGLVVVLGAYLILNTINPDTVSLSLPKVPVVKKKMFVACNMSELCRPCGEKYGLSDPYVKLVTETGAGQGAVKNGVPCSPDYIVKADAPGVKATCYGKSCGCATGGVCADTAYRCKKAKTNETGECSAVLKDSAGNPINQPPAAAGGAGTADGAGTAGGAGAAAPSLNSGTAPYICKSCVADMGACAKNGPTDACCSGFCAGNKCTGGQPGDPCGKAISESFIGNMGAQCLSQICQTNWGNSCSTGAAGTPCGANDYECRPGYKCSTNGNNECTPGTAGSWCDENSECQSGLWCDDDGFNVCMPIGVRKIFSCSERAAGRGLFYAEGCTPEMPHCVNLSSFRKNFCTFGNLGNPCGKQEDCKSFICTTLPSHTYGTCTDGLEGSPCTNDAGCKSRHCYIHGDFRVCVSGGPGSKCNNLKPAEECATGLECVGGGEWGGRCLTKPGQSCGGGGA